MILVLKNVNGFQNSNILCVACHMIDFLSFILCSLVNLQLVREVRSVEWEKNNSRNATLLMCLLFLNT